MGEFSSPFSEPPSFFFFLSLKYWNNIWFLWHYYKNSSPISKSWIRPCSGIAHECVHPRTGTADQVLVLIGSHAHVWLTCQTGLGYLKASLCWPGVEQPGPGALCLGLAKCAYSTCNNYNCKYLLNNYWTGLSEVWSFVGSNEQINYSIII